MQKNTVVVVLTIISPYSLYDPDKPGNRITIIGNPSLAEVKVMMIGIRNHSDRNQSGGKYG